MHCSFLNGNLKVAVVTLTTCELQHLHNVTLETHHTSEVHVTPKKGVVVIKCVQITVFFLLLLKKKAQMTRMDKLHLSGDLQLIRKTYKPESLNQRCCEALLQ